MLRHRIAPKVTILWWTMEEATVGWPLAVDEINQ
jgi:hypothetical protein